MLNDRRHAVTTGRPSSSSIAKPVYNFASPLIHFASGFGHPDVTGVPHIWSDGVSRVLLANNDQNRVLAYAHLRLSPDAATPDLPTFLATDGTRLLAVDGARIVVWNTAPAVSNGVIDLVIGQPSLTVNGANTGGVSAHALGGGRNAMTLGGGKLIVADPANNRVLVSNTVPTATGASADVVIGQADFVSSAPGADLDRMNAPSSVAILDGNLIVSDTGNARSSSSRACRPRRASSRRRAGTRARRRSRCRHGSTRKS